jgi:hypothetical protein
MAVYRRGYQRYRGPLSARWTRLFVLPRFAWQRPGAAAPGSYHFCDGYVLAPGCAAFIYLAHYAELLQGFEGGRRGC